MSAFAEGDEVNIMNKNGQVMRDGVVKGVNEKTGFYRVKIENIAYLINYPADRLVLKNN